MMHINILIIIPKLAPVSFDLHITRVFHMHPQPQISILEKRFDL